MGIWEADRYPKGREEPLNIYPNEGATTCRHRRRMAVPRIDEQIVGTPGKNWDLSSETRQNVPVKIRGRSTRLSGSEPFIEIVKELGDSSRAGEKLGRL